MSSRSLSTLSLADIFRQASPFESEEKVFRFDAFSGPLHDSHAPSVSSAWPALLTAGIAMLWVLPLWQSDTFFELFVDDESD